MLHTFFSIWHRKSEWWSYERPSLPVSAIRPLTALAIPCPSHETLVEAGDVGLPRAVREALHIDERRRAIPRPSCPSVAGALPHRHDEHSAPCGHARRTQGQLVGRPYLSLRWTIQPRRLGGWKRENGRGYLAHAAEATATACLHTAHCLNHCASKGCRALPLPVAVSTCPM